MRGVMLALVMSTALVGLAGLDTASAASDSVDPAEPAALTAEAAPYDGLLMPDYRRRVAVHLLSQYLRDSDGPPEISQPYHAGLLRKTPKFIVRFRLSLTGANGMLISFQDPPPRRYRCIDVEGDRGMFSGKLMLSFRHPRNDPGDLCAERVAFEPFAELDRMAGKVRACRERGDKQCVISEPDAKPQAKADPKPAKRRREAKPVIPPAEQ